MSERYPTLFMAIALALAWPQAVPGQDFSGGKTSWHGFDRFDFLMDAAALSVSPFEATADDGSGVHLLREGAIRCVVVAPQEAARGKPWSNQREVPPTQDSYHAAQRVLACSKTSLVASSCKSGG